MLILTCQIFQKGKAHKKGTKACSIRDKLKKRWQYSRYRRKPPSAADFFCHLYAFLMIMNKFFVCKFLELNVPKWNNEETATVPPKLFFQVIHIIFF